MPGARTPARAQSAGPATSHELWEHFQNDESFKSRCYLKTLLASLRRENRVYTVPQPKTGKKVPNMKYAAGKKLRPGRGPWKRQQEGLSPFPQGEKQTVHVIENVTEH